MSKKLFDHLNGVTIDKTPWKSLTEDDKKTWSNYMVNRMFSMNMDMTVIMNEFQQFSGGTLDSEMYYNLLLDVLPKKKYYTKYIKARGKTKLDEKFLKLLLSHYQVKFRYVYEYIHQLNALGHADELIAILKMYGTTDADIKLFKKQIKDMI